MIDKQSAVKRPQRKTSEKHVPKKSNSKESIVRGRNSGDKIEAMSRELMRRKVSVCSSSSNDNPRMSRESTNDEKDMKDAMAGRDKKSALATVVSGSGSKAKKSSTDCRQKRVRKSDSGKKDSGEELRSTSPCVPPSDPRAKFASKLISQKIKLISRSFNENKGYKPENTSTTAYDANPIKNRYNDVVCIDQTRVKLRERPQENDYIHANWITMPDKTRYICTQGPVQESLEDFWHMVMTEKCQVILMLCDFFEGENEKCARYIARSKELQFGPYMVKNYQLQEKNVDMGDDVEYGTWDCTNSETGVTLTVHHFACKNWTDHYAPFDPKPYLALLVKARELASAVDSNVITVHCSAGIGRTGSFVGIDLALQRLKLRGKVDMVEIMKELRQQRIQAVQSGIQFMFLQVCVLEMLVQENVIPRDEKYTEFTKDYVFYVKKLIKKLEDKKVTSKEKKEKSGAVAAADE